MSIDTGRYTEFAQQGQDALRQGLESLRTGLDSLTRTVTTLPEQLSALTPKMDVAAAVDRYADLTRTVVQVQQDAAHKLLTSTAAFRAGTATSPSQD